MSDPTTQPVTALILHWSKTGNTAKVAGALQEGLQAAELDVTRTPIDDADPDAIDAYDLVCVGFPSYRWSPPKPVDAYLGAMLRAGDVKVGAPKVPGKYALIFCTYSGPHTGRNEAEPAGAYAGQFFEHRGFTVLGHWYIVGEFHSSEEASTQGRLGDIRGRPNAQDLAWVREQARHLGRLLRAGMPALPLIASWHTVAVPPPPAITPVALAPQSTALLVLDVQTQNCIRERRPRCRATLPRIERLLAQARRHDVPVVYSLTRSATPADIRPEVAPRPGDPVVQASVDKFLGTELERVLRAQGARTVVLAGTSAHGAVLHTATGAAQRGFDVVVPVDTMSAGERYAEQSTAWHLVNAPGTRRRTTLTRSDLVTFEG